MDQSPICPHVHFYFFVFSVMSYRRKASGICAECRSSHRRCFVRKGVLRSFAKFIGKHLCQSLSFNKVGGKKQLCLGKLCKRVTDFRLSWNFDQILRIFQICYMPSTFRNSILEIFCLHLMYLLLERCITGRILVSVLHSCTLCLSLHSVYIILFSQFFWCLQQLIFFDIFNHLQ